MPQGKPGEDGDDGDNGISPTLRLTEQGIEVSYDKGDTWSLLVPISEFNVTNNITNEYINNPDEEDITVVDDKLKLNDKEYNISEFSGLGRVYLRKNIVNGKNILAYNAFNSSSTIYHIQYDYDLDGRTVVVPNNCILLFEGGSLSNGTIVGNDTVISAQLIKIFNEDISLDGTWKINGIYPEWYGATPYKKNVINNSTGLITLKESLIDSNDAFDKVKEVLVNTNIHTIILSALYYVTKEIDINVVAYYTNGTNIIGNGTDTGLIASINNISASVLSINKNNNIISQYDYLSNFAIYITKDSQLDSAILLYEIIRSTCVDVKVYGGFAKFEKGIYHLHSVVNNNIFLNVFERCIGVNSTKGGGIHYSHETYQPTLQSIQNCIFQQLAGAAIEAEPTPITGGGFGGIIQGNELEGNIKGAIALSGIHNLSVRNNYFECADYNQLINYFDNVPPAVFTFGIIQGATGANYITNVSNLEISNNQIGASAGSIDYAIIICSTQSGGRTRNVNISNNIINTSTAKNVGPKYITKAQHCSGININDNLFSINYDDVNANFPIDLNDTSSNGINYSYQSIKTSFSSAYKYGYQTNIGILRTNGFNTETNYPYLTPNKSGITVTLSAGDFILLESNNTIYKVLKGGRLHYHTSAKFTQGSNVVVCSISIWDWKVGDIVNSDYINNGTATITAIEDKGVIVGTAKFADYPSKIAAISGGGTPDLESYEDILIRMKTLLNNALAQYTDYKAGNIFAFREYSWIKGLYRWSNNIGNKAWLIGSTLYTYESGNTVFDLPLSAFNDLNYIDSEGYNYKYVIVLFHNNITIDNSIHCFYEFPMVSIDDTKSSNNGNMNLFRFVACKNTTMCFTYYDTPNLVALDVTDSVPITNTVTGYGWRGSSCEFLKGGDFSNFTGRFDFSYITFVKNVSNISQFQIQAYGQQHSVETLIAILDGLIDTSASPKSQGVGNSFNLRKLQASEAGLAAIARAEAKGWTITSNV